MSLQTWAEEFYPEPAINFSNRSDMDCLEHSLRKWEGLREEGLNRHGLVREGKTIYVAGERHNHILVGDSTCALCAKHRARGSLLCITCPLYAFLGRACDKGSGTSLAPYKSYTVHADPEPMIEALKSTLELNQVIQKGKVTHGTNCYLCGDVWHHLLGELYSLNSLISWVKEKTLVISFYRITIIIRR